MYFSSLPPKKLNPPEAEDSALSACIAHQYGVAGGRVGGVCLPTFWSRARGSPAMLSVLFRVEKGGVGRCKWNQVSGVSNAARKLQVRLRVSWNGVDRCCMRQLMLWATLVTVAETPPKTCAQKL